MIKKCTRCNKEKEYELFDKKAQDKSTGRKSWCKECCAKHAKTVWNAGKRDTDHGALSASPYMFLKHWLINVKKPNTKVRRHPVDPNLDLEDLLELWEKQNGKCAQTGIQMTHLKGSGKVDTNVSVDRINNNIKMYTKDNIQLVCYRYNMMKHQMNENDLKTWCKVILQHSK